MKERDIKISVLKVPRDFLPAIHPMVQGPTLAMALCTVVLGRYIPAMGPVGAQRVAPKGSAPITITDLLLSGDSETSEAAW